MRAEGAVHGRSLSTTTVKSSLPMPASAPNDSKGLGAPQTLRFAPLTPRLLASAPPRFDDSPQSREDRKGTPSKTEIFSMTHSTLRPFAAIALCGTSSSRPGGVRPQIPCLRLHVSVLRFQVSVPPPPQCLFQTIFRLFSTTTSLFATHS